MINDAEMITYVLQNAEMGCQGINCIRKRVHDSRVDGLLCNHLIKYGKIYHCANNMLRNRGEEIHHVSPVAKSMARMATARDLRRDPSSSHIAEMLIKGNTMGINKMTRHIRQYDGNDRNVCTLAKKMFETEEENLRELKAYL